MRNFILSLKIVLFFCISIISKGAHAQLGFCQGNSGDPIFSETFGTGSTYGPQLPAGTSTYSFVGFNGPQDGEYTIGRNTFAYGWNLPSDHTIGDTNGKALIVNASFTTGEFYKTSISGLCENTTYEFSSWLINILPSSGCGGNGIPVNVQFEIWDITDTSLLASGNTGSIFSSATPTWEQYGLVFQTLTGQTSIILKMINNGAGGCGNDLAIDDIVFKSCGDLIAVEDSSNNNSLTICSSQTPFSDTISAIPDNTVFSTHFYQWQVSTDGLSWADVTGETNASISISGITITTYYRTKVAEYETNLSNSDCITYSDVYEVIVNLAPPPPTTACWETATFSDASCSWTITGTEPQLPTGLSCWETATFNVISCAWIITGVQPTQPVVECWQTTSFNAITCQWDLFGIQPEEPTDLVCGEVATFNSVTCSWDITGGQAEEPAVECWETTTFNTTTCQWEITGTQPSQPNIECWETANFDTTTCEWIITGTQTDAPTDLECWQTATFNIVLCDWEITGTEPNQPSLECWQTTVFSTTTCQWEIFGTEPEEPTDLECWQIATYNTILCSWEISGTEPELPADLECWQTAEFNEVLCEWEVFGNQPIEFRDEFLLFCEDEMLTLDAISDIVNPTYNWISGEMSSSINIDSAGSYEVEVTDGCYTDIITFNVTEIANPVIESVETNGSSIIVNLSTEGIYLFSLDGIDYNFSNVFYNLPSGLYTIHVKSSECDIVVQQEHFHFFVQKYMTPNGDGVNDYFSLNVSQYFSSSEVYIYDRYAKLLYAAKNRSANWDGTYRNKKLPTSDYWYRIVLDGSEFKGHFTLKR